LGCPATYPDIYFHMNSFEVNVSVLEVTRFTLRKKEKKKLKALEGEHDITRPNGLQACWDEPTGDTYGLEHSTD
jgi:hypothetical protein